MIHIGVGGFHIAHLVVYLHNLMEKYGVRDFATTGVGLQPFDASMRDIPKNQDHLTLPLCVTTMVTLPTSMVLASTDCGSQARSSEDGEFSWQTTMPEIQ